MSPSRSDKGRAYLSLLHTLPCVVCLNREGKESIADEAHHVEAYRGEHSTYATVPLCGRHHDQLHAMHRRPFYLLYNIDDIKLLAWTARVVHQWHLECGK